MNGADRVRLQRMAGVRDIVADIDALKLKYGFDRVTVLTPRAETNLRLGQKSLKPIRVQFRHSESVSCTMCFSMFYPSEPLVLESVECTCSEGDLAGELQAASEQALREHLLSRAGAEEGYAVPFTELFSQCQWPSAPATAEVSHSSTCSPQSDTTCVLSEQSSSSIFRADDHEPSSSVSVAPAVTSPAASASAPYKCRKCRSVVFTAADLAEPHPLPAPCQRGRRPGAAPPPPQKQPPCPALLLCADRVSWVAELANAVTAPHISGSLPCPQCATKLGAFDWSGAKCACGHWVAPSFKITSSKVDVPLPQAHAAPQQDIGEDK